MELHDAIELIRFSPLPTSSGAWAELGCGSGLFTQALAHLLAPDSIICAVDQNASALRRIPAIKGTTVKKLQSDFIRDDLHLPQLDGILMANSLHFVEDKISFISKMKKNLIPGGQFLIVEYDTDSSNMWVPFPISFHSLNQLFGQTGDIAPLKLHELPSKFRRANIYSAIITIK